MTKSTNQQDVGQRGYARLDALERRRVRRRQTYKRINYRQRALQDARRREVRRFWGLA